MKLNLVRIFSLSGFGEPTLNPDFFSIISKLKNETKAKIDLISNGSDLNKLFECEADTIHISCYSPSIEENLINQTIHDSRITIIPKYNQENFNNRAGNVFISDTQIDQCCNVLLMKLSIDYNGDILKCCSDWTKRDILGNVYTNNIWDIWFNKTMYDKINMIENKRSRIEICKNCNAEGSLYGEQYKEFWKKYYEEKNKSTDNNKLFL